MHNYVLSICNKKCFWQYILIKYIFVSFRIWSCINQLYLNIDTIRNDLYKKFYHKLKVFYIPKTFVFKLPLTAPNNDTWFSAFPFREFYFFQTEVNACNNKCYLVNLKKASLWFQDENVVFPQQYGSMYVTSCHCTSKIHDFKSQMSNSFWCSINVYKQRNKSMCLNKSQYIT